MTSPNIRCGDIVLHRPTGEEWLVAYADYETGVLAWSGWPVGRARIEDCAVVRRATDEEHAAHVAEWMASTSGDHRKSAVERLYAQNGALTVIDEIAAERRRQIEAEGWTLEHDAQHTGGELLTAAQCYRINAVAFADAPLPDDYSAFDPPPAWPWDRAWWKPRNPRRDLIRAAALTLAEIDLGRITTQAWAEHDIIIAEIERLDRLPLTEKES